jgi:hypothetical protein
MELFITVVMSVIAFKYDHLNYLFRRLYPYSEQLDNLTNVLLDKYEAGNYNVELDEYTIQIEGLGTLWISNYPYSYGHYWDHTIRTKKESVSYKTFKRVRKLHLKLLDEKKLLDKQKELDYYNEKLKQLTGE